MRRVREGLRGKDFTPYHTLLLSAFERWRSDLARDSIPSWHWSITPSPRKVVGSLRSQARHKCCQTLACLTMCRDRCRISASASRPEG